MLIEEEGAHTIELDEPGSFAYAMRCLAWFLLAIAAVCLLAIAAGIWGAR